MHYSTKVRHSNNKTSFINNEASNGISVWTVQDEFFKAVIMPTDKDPKTERKLRQDAKDKIYRLAPQVAAKFQPGNYDTKDLKKMVHEVARQNGLKVRLSPEEIEELNAKRKEAAERRELQQVLRKQEDELVCKIAFKCANLLSSIRFEHGWQKEKCTRMCVKATLEAYKDVGDKVFEMGGKFYEVFDKCVKALNGKEVYKY